jgi:hypothetical protein
VAKHDRGTGPDAGPITHARAETLFSIARDGEIGKRELQALQEHLRGCPDCVRATGRMRSFLELLDDLTCRD